MLQKKKESWSIYTTTDEENNFITSVVKVYDTQLALNLSVGGVVQIKDNRNQVIGMYHNLFDSREDAEEALRLNGF